MTKVTVNLVLENDYNDGLKNGEIKTVEVNVKSKNDIIKAIEEKFELNMVDMWKIKSISLV